MDANLKKFNCSFKYVLGEDFEMPGQKKKNQNINTETSLYYKAVYGRIDRSIISPLILDLCQEKSSQVKNKL